MFPKTIMRAIVFAGSFFLAGSTPLFGQACAIHQALLKKIDQIFETQAVDRLGEVYHTDAVIHNPENTLRGLDKITESMKEFYTNVSDAKGTNHDVFCNGDKMVVRWTGSGNMSGNKVDVSGITIYHTRNGKVAEVWEAMDMLAMMQQMGFELKPPGGQ